MGSEHTITETIEKLEAAAREASLSVERMNNSKVIKKRPQNLFTRTVDLLDVVKVTSS